MALQVTGLDGKVVIITGASRGIGRQLALDFAAHGARVAGIARRAEAIDETARAVTAAGGTMLAVVGDVSRPADCQALCERTIAAFGRIDVLVNNVGMSGPIKFVRDLQPEEWRAVIDTNLTSAYLCIHYAVAPMMARKCGAIINISSLTGKRPFAKRVAYAASKLALVGLTRTLAQELGPYNIRVNTVTPGPVEGERVDEVIDAMAATRNMSREDVRELLLDWSPLHKMVTPADISNMTLYLASDLGKHMTGQDINVTAGIVMFD
jgi:NAD(P)-dependent dehydrogenase (short-subunit alcohol dehydrogenase family)